VGCFIMLNLQLGGPMLTILNCVSNVHDSSWLVVMVASSLAFTIWYGWMELKKRQRALRVHEPRVAVICGGGTGIGIWMARRLKAKGFIVFNGNFDESLRRTTEALDHSTTAVATDEFGNYSFFLDVRSDDSILQFYRAVRKTLRALELRSAVHVLINNAAVINARPLEYAMLLT